MSHDCCDFARAPVVLHADEDGVPLSTVVKVVKHAYNYEQWETFDSMIDGVMAAIKEANDPKYGPEEKALELLIVSPGASDCKPWSFSLQVRLLPGGSKFC